MAFPSTSGGSPNSIWIIVYPDKQRDVATSFSFSYYLTQDTGVPNVTLLTDFESVQTTQVPLTTFIIYAGSASGAVIVLSCLLVLCFNKI
jgi:hypothetical protein